MSSSRARSAIQESLTKKGFMEKPGGDHFRYVFVLRDGRKTGVFTKMSRGTQYKYLSDNLLAQMARQCKLTKIDFLALVDCPLSREAYEEKLREQHCL